MDRHGPRAANEPKQYMTSCRGPRSVWHRIGWEAVVTLILTTLVTLAVIGFLGFLWFADLTNDTWHRIMVTGWATRAVSISTLVLRFAIDLQAGIAAAMLAALILESSSVLLEDAAKISAMRASSPQARALLELIPAMSRVERAFLRFDLLGELNIISLGENG